MEELAYRRPESLSEALEILLEKKRKAFPLAGGTDLLVDLRAGKFVPELLVDISRLIELRNVNVEKGIIRCGAGLTMQEISEHNVISELGVVLAQAASKVATPQIRNRATIGGNIMTSASVQSCLRRSGISPRVPCIFCIRGCLRGEPHPSPYGDTTAALMALGAKVHLASVGEERSLAIEDFLKPAATDRKPSEIITGVSFHLMGTNDRGVFLKVGSNRACTDSIITIAVVLRQKEGNGSRVDDARIVLGGLGPTVMRAKKAEKILLKTQLITGTIGEVIEAALGECQPHSDIRASSAYRLHLCRYWLGEAFKGFR